MNFYLFHTKVEFLGLLFAFLNLSQSLKIAIFQYQQTTKKRSKKTKEKPISEEKKKKEKNECLLEFDNDEMPIAS